MTGVQNHRYLSGQSDPLRGPLFPACATKEKLSVSRCGRELR